MIKISALDTMFGATDNITNNIINIPANKIIPNPKHHFRIIESKLIELEESIKQHGIITPLIVRECSEVGYYELLAGYHRKAASDKIPLQSVPCVIKTVDDDTAVQIMIESNKQRGFSDMLPSEIAFALKMEHDIFKRQGKRNDLILENALENTSAQFDQKCQSEKTSHEKNLSPANIRRYIRLTNLITPLLDLLDSSKIKFIVGVELSFLKHEEQHTLHDYIVVNKVKIDIKTAKLIRELSNNDNLSATTLLEIFGLKEKKTQKQQDNILLDISILKNYIENDIDTLDYHEYILQALQFYKNHFID